MRHRYMLFMCILVLTADAVLAVEQNKQAFLYDDYAAVLKDHVDNNTGMVDYRKLKAKPQRLDAFTTAMSKLDPNSYKGWNKQEKIALWLNAYNAFTLKAIIDNYPIKPGLFKSMYYPKNSIRQISGVWDKMKFNVMGNDYTLEHIEHKILRKNFDEPRIHVAMVCAAMGCPPLRNEPYVAEKLDKQLDDQSKQFLLNSAKFRIDRAKAVVYLSPILRWFAKDFQKKRAHKKGIGKHGKRTSAVLNFIAPYLKEADKSHVLAGKFKIKYLKYDWSLNEQKPTPDTIKQKKK